VLAKSSEASVFCQVIPACLSKSAKSPQSVYFAQNKQSFTIGKGGKNKVCAAQERGALAPVEFEPTRTKPGGLRNVQ